MRPSSMVANFLLMTHRQNGDGFTVEAIARHIAAVAKVNQPFPVVLWHVGNGAPNLRLVPKHFYCVDD